MARGGRGGAGGRAGGARSGCQGAGGPAPLAEAVGDGAAESVGVGSGALDGVAVGLGRGDGVTGTRVVGATGRTGTGVRVNRGRRRVGVDDGDAVEGAPALSFVASAAFSAACWRQKPLKIIAGIVPPYTG